MKKLLLNLYFWPAFFILTFFGIMSVPLILLFNVLFLRRDIPTAIRLAIRVYGWVIVCAIPFMAPVKVKGKIGNIPKPSIIVANHSSAIDPYLFGAIPIENCFVTSWPFKIPIYSNFMKLAGYINTTSGWDTIREQCAAMLAKDIFVTIWPEGHRSRNGEMGRFRKGAFQLAVETGKPIQPVCIIGSGEVLPPGKKFLSPGKIKLVLLDPIYPDPDLSEQEAINELRRKSVAALSESLQINQLPKNASLKEHTPPYKQNRIVESINQRSS